MPEPDDLTFWVNRLKEGDEQAADVIWNACAERLERLAKKKLAGGPQRGADEEDVALSAMNSFMMRYQDGRIEQIEDRDELWKLLFTITVRKSLQHLRKQNAAKRKLERGEADLDQGWDPDRRAHLDGFAKQGQLTPDELVSQLEEQDILNQVLGELDESLQAIVVAKLSGHTNEEISDQLGCSCRTVERKLKLIRAKWQSANRA